MQQLHKRIIVQIKNNNFKDQNTKYLYQLLVRNFNKDFNRLMSISPKDNKEKGICFLFHNFKSLLMQEIDNITYEKSLRRHSSFYYFFFLEKQNIYNDKPKTYEIHSSSLRGK